MIFSSCIIVLTSVTVRSQIKNRSFALRFLIGCVLNLLLELYLSNNEGVTEKIPMKKYGLNLILIIVSFALSRSAFFLINDPEGPNLLIVSVLALGIFSVLRLFLKLVAKK